MNDPWRIAYQSTTPNLNGGFASFYFGLTPANHRLVVQHVAFGLSLAIVPSQVTISYVGGQGQLLGGIASVPVSAPVAGISGIVFDALTQFYIDQGGAFRVNVNIGQIGFSVLEQEVTVIGYLLDSSAAPCSAIAQ